MSLTIHKLSTRCRSPRGVERAGMLVEDVVRELLASELGGQLGPSLDRLPGVTRLKDLRVKVKIPVRKLNAIDLASAWARAFTLALHQALAHPPGDGAIFSRRYESDAAYEAAMLRHISTKGVAPCWEFPELEAWRGAPPAEAALARLLQQPQRILEILAQMERRGWLDGLLALWDELSLEQMMRAVADNGNTSPGLSLENLIDLGRAAAAAGALRSEWAFAGRRQAIRLWGRLHFRFPLREVWHGLRLLQRFLEVPALLIIRDPALLVDEVPFPSWCEAILRSASLPVRAALADEVVPGQGTRANVEAGSARSPSGAKSVSDLLSVLEGLRPLVPSAASSISTSRSVAMKWIVSDCAGMLLMLSIVQRLELWRFIRKPEFVRLGGPRAFSFLLAATGMTLLKRWSLEDPVEPIVALFAGILSEPDVAGMRQFFSETDVSAVAEFVQAENWAEALDRAATELAHSFASRVLGFRRASREAVVKQFLRVPGRVLVEETRVLAVFPPSAWAVALHISGMDDPLGRIEWMGGRRVEFVLEGL